MPVTHTVNLVPDKFKFQEAHAEQGYIILANDGPNPFINIPEPGEILPVTDLGEDVKLVVIGRATYEEWVAQRRRFGGYGWCEFDIFIKVRCE